MEISLCMGSHVTPYSAISGITWVCEWSSVLGMSTLAILLRPMVQVQRPGFLRFAGGFAQRQLSMPFQARQRVLYEP